MIVSLVLCPFVILNKRCKATSRHKEVPNHVSFPPSPRSATTSRKVRTPWSRNLLVQPLFEFVWVVCVYCPPQFLCTPQSLTQAVPAHGDLASGEWQLVPRLSLYVSYIFFGSLSSPSGFTGSNLKTFSPLLVRFSVKVCHSRY